jgi:hypothetical protein
MPCLRDLPAVDLLLQRVLCASKQDRLRSNALHRDDEALILSLLSRDLPGVGLGECFVSTLGRCDFLIAELQQRVCLASA